MLAVVCLTLLAVGLMAAQLFLAAGRVDIDSRQRQEQSAFREILERVEAVPEDQKSITIWDDAVENTLRPDRVWLDENMVTWAHDYFSHDEVYVLSERDTLLLGYAGGEVQEPETGSKWLDPFLPLVKELRRQFSLTRDANIQVYGIAEVRGELAVVSASPILPYSDRIATPEVPSVYISVLYLNPTLRELHDAHAFDDVSASVQRPTSRTKAFLPLRGFDGQTVGYLTWTPFRPGQLMIIDSLPILIVAALILGAVAWAGTRKLVKNAAELTAKEAQARHLAFHDTLTGLPNRTLIMERIQSAIHQSQVDEQVAVHYVDIDHFKAANDSLGHAAGDELLREVAHRLTSLLGDRDFAARLGGDEFVLLQCGVTALEQVEAMASRLVEALGEPVALGGTRLPLSASLGVGLSEGIENGAEVLRRADIALYRAKADGRNGYRIFSAEMDQAVEHRRLLEADLAAALTRGDQLSLVYQPLYSTDGSRIEGVEALVRWKHPEKGHLAPSLFIPAAEESGLIVPLGEWILREACRQAACWQVGYVAVNVSPVQFRQSNFIETVRTALRESGLRPARLELEITEGMLVDNARASKAIATLRQMGVKIALDDFGTGYSSLRYLRQMHVDKIKIDQSFVQQSTEDDGAKSIIIAMVQLASAIHVQVTAEGVETAEQKDFLASIGCDQLQGYLLSRPLAPEQIGFLLGQHKAAA